ncbi:MAG: MerR family transcriptional regulator [Thermoanaerobaculia bacterium]|nr:MerR family transcriptional regulator [Thermoanaerobaculia bacterium]
MNATDSLSSGELAAQTGVSADTLRHYELKGVLPAPPRRGTYRRYPLEAADRVRAIRRAMSIGFTLDELARIFSIRRSGKAPCRTALALAEAKRDELDRRITEMIELRAQLDAITTEWRHRLNNTPAGQPARLLERMGERS